MLNNVMPQRGVFFSLLSAHTDFMVSGANATLRLISGLGNPNVDNAALIAEVNFNEDSADDVKTQLIKLLYESFTTPINRDQIHTLTLDLDRIVDSVQSVANSIDIYHINTSTPRAREMASFAADACIRLNRAVIALATRERTQVILKQCQEVDEIESRAVEVMRQAVAQLFEADGDDAAVWHAMKMRGFYFMQEAVLDNCKRAAKTLEEILLENA
jgi:uncharacterized protein Yka (UPF0111/DUF47 family)